MLSAQNGDAHHFVSFSTRIIRIGQDQQIVFNRQCSVGISGINPLLRPTIDFGQD